MTLDDLKKQMAELGFGWQPYPTDVFKVGLFYKRIETKRVCTDNDKNQFVVEVFDYEGLPGVADEIRQRQRFSLAAEVTGEFPVSADTLQWAKLQVYGLTPEMFFAQHKHIEAALIRAWEALT